MKTYRVFVSRYTQTVEVDARGFWVDDRGYLYFNVASGSLGVFAANCWDSAGEIKSLHTVQNLEA